MTSPPESPEIIVRVEPRLLNDVLCVALRQQGLSVSAVPAEERRSAPRAARRFDVAIVTEPLPPDAAADRVIEIDETGAPVAHQRNPSAQEHGEQGLALLLRELRRTLGTFTIA